MKSKPELLVSALALACCRYEPWTADAVFFADGVPPSVVEVELDTARRPTALAFPPGSTELWLTMRVDGTPTIEIPDTLGFLETDDLIDDDGKERVTSVTAVPTELTIGNSSSNVDRPIAIAFASARRFATCGESRGDKYGTEAPDDYAGPVLWPLDKQVLEQSEIPGERIGAAVAALHESPNCMGLAWESGRVFWAFDGCGGRQLTDPGPPAVVDDCDLVGDLVRYEFGSENVPGRSDMARSGTVTRYPGLVTRVPGVAAGMVFDRTTGQLYVVDPGGRRVLRIDPSLAYRESTRLDQADPNVAHYSGTGLACSGGDNGCWVVVDSDADLGEPSGIALWNRQLIVSDSGRLVAFELPKEPPTEALEQAAAVDLDKGELRSMVLAGDKLWVIAPSTGLLRLAPQVEFVRP